MNEDKESQESEGEHLCSIQVSVSPRSQHLCTTHPRGRLQLLIAKSVGQQHAKCEYGERGEGYR